MTLQVRVEGLSKLSRELRKISADLPKELNAVAKDAAEIVADEARASGPRQTGALLRTVRTGATRRGSVVRAGRGKVVYAPVIHFGWHAHNIEPNPFLYDALDRRRSQVIKRFEQGVADLIDKRISPGTGGRP